MKILLTILLLDFLGNYGVFCGTKKKPEVCGGTFSGYQYMISSPNYPSEYPENQDCFYFLQGTRLARCEQEFHLQFLDFDIKASENCGEDFLQIGELNIYCGKPTGLRIFKGLNNVLKIRFRSKKEVSGKGFRILVTTLPCVNSQLGQNSNSTSREVSSRQIPTNEKSETSTKSPIEGKFKKIFTFQKPKSTPKPIIDKNVAETLSPVYRSRVIFPTENNFQESKNSSSQKSAKKLDPSIYLFLPPSSDRKEISQFSSPPSTEFSLPILKNVPFRSSSDLFKLSQYSIEPKTDFSLPVFPNAPFQSLKNSEKLPVQSEKVSENFYQEPINQIDISDSGDCNNNFSDRKFQNCRNGVNGVKTNHFHVFGSGSGSVFDSESGSAFGSGIGSGSGSAFGPGIGSGSGSAFGSGIGSGSGSVFGSGIDSGSGSTFGSGSDFVFGSGIGFGSGPESSLENGSGSGSVIGSGTNFVIGSGSGSVSNSASGSGSNFASGSGSSSRFGSETGIHSGQPLPNDFWFPGQNSVTNIPGIDSINSPGINPNYLPGINSGITPNLSPGIVPGTGSGFIPGSDSGIGSGFIPGVDAVIGPGIGPGINSGIIPGVNPGIGSGIIPGGGSGIYPGSGSGIIPGVGSGIIPGISPGIGSGIGSGISPGFNNNYAPNFPSWSGPRSECCKPLFPSQRSLISSPGFPSLIFSPTPFECSYTINKFAPSVCRLRLNFKFFNLGTENPFCTDGFLEVDNQRICGCKSGLSLVFPFAIYPGKVINVRYLGFPNSKFNGFLLEAVQEVCGDFPLIRNRKDLAGLNETFSESRTEGEFGNISKSINLHARSKREGYEYPRPTGHATFDVHLGGGRSEKLFLNSCQSRTFFDWILAAKEAFILGARCPGSGSSGGLISIIPALAGWHGFPGICEEIAAVEGVIASPLYPQFYPKNLRKCYRFYRAPGFCQLELSVLDFNLEPSVGCAKDYLLFGGQNRRYCGNSLLGRRTLFDFSRSKVAEIYFVTDSFGSGRGFTAGFVQRPC